MKIVTQYLFSLIIASLLFVVSCKDDDDDSQPVVRKAELEMVFNPTINGAPLVFSDSAEDHRGSTIITGLLQYFISNIHLIDNNGTKVLAKDVVWIDHTYGDSNVVFEVTPGEYTGIEFGIGLDEKLNATDPIAVPSRSPLSNTNLYWGWAAKFQFVKIEAKVDSANTDNYFIINYHTGLDSSYRVVQFDKSMRISENERFTLNFSLDLNDVFTKVDTLNYYNPALRSWHGETSTAFIARILSDNFAASIALKE